MSDDQTTIQGTLKALRQAIDDLSKGFTPMFDAFRAIAGLPSIAEIEQQERINQHMARCARNRQRDRRKRTT